MVVQNGHIGGARASGNSYYVDAAGYTNGSSYTMRSPNEDTVDVDMERLPREPIREAPSQNGACHHFKAPLSPSLRFPFAGKPLKRHSWDLGGTGNNNNNIKTSSNSSSNSIHNWFDRSDIQPRRSLHQVEHSRYGSHSMCDVNGTDGDTGTCNMMDLELAGADKSLRDISIAGADSEGGQCHHQYPLRHHRNHDNETGEDYRPRFHQPVDFKEDSQSARTVGQDARLYERKLWLQREQELYVQAMRLKRTCS
ncbi:hypothetical protein EGW08_019652 [Elysia chlorotica]|uniref:Uncharacterized protein n=1 Tax=Elysia chlorotica TaxID=188477 RepID=A0A433STM8_ELYCH|nr:hypothetical protein EGW08_019652 [Elysia chlorotica]